MVKPRPGVAIPRFGKCTGELLVLACFLSFGAGAGRAQCGFGLNTVNWTNADGTGRWSDATNWNPSPCQPYNTFNKFYDVSLGSGNGFIYLDSNSVGGGSPTLINSLAIGLGTTLNNSNSILAFGSALTIGDPNAPAGHNIGVLNNAGEMDMGRNLTIDISAAAQGATVTQTNSGVINLSSLSLNGNDRTFSFSGGGAINLGGSNFSIQGGAAHVTMDNVDNTISGAGGILNLTLINDGTISATGGDLTIRPTALGFLPQGNSFTNNNLVTVASAAALVWDSTNGLGGSGSLGTSVATAGFNNQGVVTVSDGGTLRLLTLDGATAYFNNDGNIVIGSSAGATMELSGNGSTFDLGSVAGTGSLTLNNSTISGVSGTESLINDTGHTIEGSGALSNLSITNAGTISATAGDLTITPANGQTVTNNNVMTVASAATLHLDYSNQPFFTSAFSNSSTGTITVNGNGALQVDSPNGVSPVLNNDGQINISSLGGTFRLNGADTFYLVSGEGSGVLSLGGSGSSITGATGAEKLVNGSGSTINGAGTISNMTFVNNNVLQATGGTLTLQTSIGGGQGNNIANNGTMQVLSGATLAIDTTSFPGTSLSNPAFNNGGTVTVNDGGNLNLLAPSGQTAYFNNDGSIAVGGSAGASLVLTGNGSTFDLGSAAGTGSVTLNNATISGFDGTQTLLNDSGHTIQGSGTISNLTLTNNGAIVANTGSLTITPAAGGLTNFGTMTSTGAGDLIINTSAGSLTNNGTIDITNSTSLTVNGDFAANNLNLTMEHVSTLNVNGNFNNSSSSSNLNLLTLSNATITGSLLNNNAVLVDNSTLNVNTGFTEGDHAGVTIQNNGILNAGGTFNNTGDAASVTINGGTLNAGGDFNNNGSLNNGNVNVQSGGTLAVTGALTNSGAINTGNGISDAGGNNITVTGALTNSGEITLAGQLDGLSVHTLTNTGQINLTGTFNNLTNAGDFNNNGAGSLSVSGSRDGVSVTGKFNNAGSSTLAMSGDHNNMGVGGAFNNSSAATVTLAGNNNSLTVTGAFNNNGAVTLNGTGDSLSANLSNTGSVGLAGNNETLTSSGSFTNISGSLGLTGNNDTMTVAKNLFNTTLEGFGAAGVSLSGDTDTLTVKGALDNSVGSTVRMIGSNGSIAVTGKLNNDGTISLTGSNNSLSADLDNSGTITLGGTGDSLTDTGVFNNNGGSLEMNGANGSVSVALALTNSAAGSVSLTGNGDVLSADTFTNTNGIVFIGQGESVNVTNNYSQSGAGATIEVNGILVAIDAMINGGKVFGSGDVDANVINNGGTVNVSDPSTPSILTINGDYTQGAGGTLLIDILGTGPGQYSVLDVTGKATLDGILNLDFLNGYTAGSFSFLEFSSLVGNFSTIEVDGSPCAGCIETFGAGGITVATPSQPSAPEPSTWGLMGGALLTLVAYRMLLARRKAQLLG